MVTVRSILTRSVRLLGALAQGATLRAEAAADALLVLNSMLQSWNMSSLTIFTKDFDAYTLVPGKQMYTIGPSGDIAVAPQIRPTNIDRAQLRVMSTSPVIELPVELVNDAVWADIRVKGIQTPYPSKMYSDGDYPNTGLYLWPVPTFAHQLILWTWRQISVLDDLNADINLPPGYERAIIYNLAIELSGEYAVVPPPQVVQIATDALVIIKRVNSSNETMKCDPGTLSRSTAKFNWLTGE